MSAESERWVYGYGKAKHILDEARMVRGEPWRGPGLCGAWGDYPFPEPDRPACKRCLKRLAGKDLGDGRVG